jgi:hypothetical protein
MELRDMNADTIDDDGMMYDGRELSRLEGTRRIGFILSLLSLFALVGKR